MVLTAGLTAVAALPPRWRDLQPSWNRTRITGCGVRREVVLFGGVADSVPLDDTWTLSR